MKLRTRLAIGFLAAVAMMLPIAFVSLRTFDRIHEEFYALKDDIIPGALAMGEMERVAIEAHHQLMEYMVHGKQEDRRIAQSRLDSLTKAGLEHMEHEAHIGPDQQRAAEELMAGIERFRSAVVAILDLKRRGVPAEALSRKEDETVHPAEAALARQVRGHKAVHMEELAEAERAVHAAHAAGARLVGLAAACAVLIALAAALVTSRSIVKPLRALDQATRKVADGDLNHRIGSNRKDEIGDLARRFDRMTDALSTTLVSKEVLERANAALESEIAERRRAEAALRESEERLRVTLGSIGDGVIATDTARRVTRLNKVAEALTGWGLEEALGRPVGEVFRIVNERTREPAPDPIERVIETGRAQALANHTALIGRDGTERPIADSAAPIRDAAGELIGVVMVFRDVTEERRHRQEKDRLLHDIGERVNELDCLYGLSKIIERPGATLEDVFDETASLLPASWRWPEIARGRVRHEGQVFGAPAGPAGPWRQSADISVGGRKVGSVEVCYRQAAPEADEGPFTKEERALIDAIAERLGRAIQSKRAEEALKQRSEELARSNAELLEAREALERVNRRLETLATTDVLTGLSNRRQFMQDLHVEVERARRAGAALSLAMIDVDRFKSINDTCGHAFGDRVLVEVARALRAGARVTDGVARLGGDELAILMPGASAPAAAKIMERIRKRIAAREVSDGRCSLPVTVSTGIGAFGAGDDENALMHRADEALYAAKAAGANCTRAAEPAPGAAT